MACVVRDKAKRNGKPRSPYWYACYTDANGRRLKKSTGLTSRSKAMHMAHMLEKACVEARQKVLTEARARELLSEVLQSINVESLTVFTVEQWFTQFVKGKKKSRAAKTGARHEHTMREFTQFLGSKARLNIAAITSKDIADFRDQREAGGLAPATLNIDIAILSSAFNAAWKQGHISVNPCLAIEPVKDNGRQRKGTFTPDQVKALVNTAEGDWKGLILVAYYTGQRLGDCANLRWRDIDLVSEIKTIRFTPSKTGGEVVTVVHPTLEDYLLNLATPKTDEEFLFPTLAQRNASTLSNWFREIMEKARIEQREIRKRISKGGRSVSALSFHSLRHSFTSALANLGVAEEMRMALTGHKSRDDHRTYTHHELQRMHDAVALLPRIK